MNDDDVVKLVHRAFLRAMAERLHYSEVRPSGEVRFFDADGLQLGAVGLAELKGVVPPNQTLCVNSLLKVGSVEHNLQLMSRKEFRKARVAG